MDDFAEDLPRGDQSVSVPDSSAQFFLSFPQLLLRLQAHPPRHSSHLSTSLSLLGISWLSWMLSAHLVLLLHL